MSAVGTLTHGALAAVDDHGRVTRDRLTLSWRVRAGDRWIDPACDVSARHTRPGAAPVFETAVRIPGGDAVARIYGVGERGGLVVLEIENRSADAVAIAFALDGEPGEVLALPGKPGAVEPDGALVYPLPHRVRIRVALGDARADVRALPDAGTITRGWNQMLEHGMRTELPDPLQGRVDAARADLLLAPASADAFVALEAWGFDTEAVVMWPKLGMRARRTARRRTVDDDALLAQTRAALVHEHANAVDILPGFRAEWLGHNIAVRDIPLRSGRLSYAIRWHGERPALLWEAPAGCELRAGGLDPGWSSTEAAGETLLAAPPREMVVPESFS